MNSIRPQISYKELLAARQHANELLKEFPQLFIKLNANYNKEKEQLYITNLTNKELEREYKKNLEELKENRKLVENILNKIDEKFIEQALMIENQIDINYPQT